jgi:hypothetical protein
MNLVDDVHFGLALSWSNADFFPQISYFIDPPVGGGVNFDHIHEATLVYIAAGRALVAGFTGRRLFTIQRFGNNFGHAGFAGSPGSGKKVGMGNFIVSHCVLERFDDTLLSYYFFKGSRTPGPV